jgi:hypothetical protein
MTTQSPRWLSNEQLAERFGVPLRTVMDWRYRRVGPPGVRIGRHVRYLEEDVLVWEQRKRVAAP